MSLSSVEIDLWLKVCIGDINAFNLLFRAEYKKLFISALLLLKNEKDAEDVVQDVFFKVWTKRETLSGVNNYKSYLYTAVRNASFDQLRKLKINEDIADAEFVDNALDPFHLIRIKDLNRSLKQAVDDLPAQCKVVFEMIYLEGKKYQEVADELGLSINTIKTQLKRALEKLRYSLKKLNNMSPEI